MKTLFKKAVVLLTVMAMLVSMIPGMPALAVVDNSPVVKVVPRALNADGSAGDVIDPATLQVGDAFVAAVEVHNLPEDSYFKNVQICLCWDDSKVVLADSDGEVITPNANATVNSTGKKALINVSDELLFNEDEETGWLSTIIEWNKTEKGSVPNAINYTATITDSYLYFEDYLYTDVMYPLEDTSVFVYGIRLSVKELGDTKLAVCKDQTTVYAFNTSFSYDAIPPYVPIENAIINFPSTADGWWQVRYNDLAVDRTPIYAGPAPTQAPTAVPTEVPATEVPVTQAPATLFAEYDLSSTYHNGPNGTTSYSAPVLTMTKDKAGSNFNEIIWADTLDSAAADQTFTILFDAKVSGGLGHSWDGYAISLRNNSGGDTELVRLVPTGSGVDITKGAGQATIGSVAGTGYHAYSCQFNKAANTVTVYVDGVKVIDNAALGWSGTPHGLYIKNGHNDATNCVINIADFEAWTGETVRTAPGSYGSVVTEEPAGPTSGCVMTEEPPVTEAPVTEAPAADYTGKVPVAGTSVFANMYTNNNVTGTNGAASGNYELDANNGDASLYLWADAQVTALNEGKEVMVSFTIDVPATNAVDEGENGVQIAYMNRAQQGTGIYTFPKGATYDVQLALLPNGNYILVVDDVQVATGTLDCAFADLWNICWRTYWAGNTNTLATVSNVSSAEIAEWVVPSGTTEAPVTEEPVVTEVPVTGAPGMPPTQAPTGVTLFAEYDLASVYENGPNGTSTYSAPVLTMVKDAAGSNFNNIIWSDSADSLTDTMTLAFDAKVSGGLGHSWDGYAISLRTNSGGDCELVRLVPTAEGVDITKNAGAATIGSVNGTGYHAYSCQYNKANDTLTVYVDGVKVIDNVALGWSGATQHGFLLKSGHNDATGVAMNIADVDLYTGSYVRAVPSVYDDVTEAPVTEAPGVTEEPGVTEAPVTQAPVTEAPTENPYVWVANFTGARYDQQQDGLIEYNAETGLHMKKSGTQTGFCSILWSDSFDNASHPATYTLHFNAKQTGGYAGNTWDGYGISVRHQGGSSDTEIIRLVPSAAGVDVYVNGSSGTKVASIYDSNAHDYDVTFDEDAGEITSVKIDGVEKLANPIAWSAPASYHGIMVKSGHNDATNAELWLKDTYIAVGEGIVETPTEAPSTEAPSTEAPATEAPATEAPVTEAPATEAPTEPGTTEAPATEAPTEPGTTEAPATEAPTEPGTTEAPSTEAPTEPGTTEAPAGELTISSASVSVKVGKSTAVRAYLDGVDITESAIWRSAKTSVAKVEDGVIKGVKAGSTTVTVEYEGQVKQITVKVTESGSGPSGSIGSISKPTEAPEKMFIDIDNVPWAVNAIEALAKAGIVNGVGNQMFDPNGLVTREQFAKMLIEACGFNYSGATCDFYDVVTGAWYYRYISEAYRQGIMKGINEENMGIGMNITRQDLCTMVYRALQVKGIALPVVEGAQNFADGAQISDYAKEAVTALQQAGIIDGMGDGTFAPQATATRAQAAKIIYGVYELISK